MCSEAPKRYEKLKELPLRKILSSGRPYLQELFFPYDDVLHGKKKHLKSNIFLFIWMQNHCDSPNLQIILNLQQVLSKAFAALEFCNLSKVTFKFLNALMNFKRSSYLKKVRVSWSYVSLFIFKK